MMHPPGDDEIALYERLRTLPDGKRSALRQMVTVRKKTGHQLIAETLRRCGVRNVIGITGTPVDPTFGACWAESLRIIGCRHQQTSVLMAAAANYVAGRLENAVVVSAGPAVTNALTGVLVARDNGWPVIVIGGRRPIHEEGIGYFQELDAVPIYSNVSKWALTVERATDIPDALRRAYEVACTGRPGPVYLDLPEDVLTDAVETPAFDVPRIPTPPNAASDVLADCIARLESAERPLLILGDGIRWAYDRNALLELVARFGTPFITSPLARGFLPDDHALCANSVRRWIQSRADVVLMAGASLDWRFRFGGELAADSTVIHVDLDPVASGHSRIGTVPVYADSGRFLTAIRNSMNMERARMAFLHTAPWRREVESACNRKRAERAEWIAQKSDPMSPQQLFGELREFLQKDSIVVLDGNTTLATGQAALLAHAPCSWLDPGWNGCMGSGVPFGMGAKLAAPDHTVVVVCGDFSFGLTAMDLETAARHRIPIIVVIANNDGIGGSLRQKGQLPADYPELFSRYQPGLRYERIVEVFGGYGEYVTAAAEVGPALERAKESGRVSCINVQVNPEAAHPGSW